MVNYMPEMLQKYEKYDGLKATYSNFLKASLAYITNNAKKKPMYEKDGLAVRRDSNGNISGFSRTHLLDRVAYCQGFHDDLIRLNEFGLCLDMMCSELKKKTPDLQMDQHFVNLIGDQWVFRFILGYAEMSENLEFDAQNFNIMFNRLIDICLIPSKLARIDSPIINLRSDYSINEITLEEGLKIRRISDRDFNALFQLSEQNLTRTISFMDLSRINFIIEQYYDDRNSINYLRVKELYDTVLFGIRLVKGQNVGFNTIIINHAGWPEQWQSQSVAPAHSFMPNGAIVALNENDVKELTRLWPLIRKYSSDISIAMSRFNYACERENEKDRLLDYAIGLESLFGGSGGYAIAARTAQFVGGEVKDRYNIFNKVRDAYDLRNKLAHGSSSIKESDLTDINNNLRKYLAFSIVKFLDGISMLGSKEKLMKSVEMQFFGNLVDGTTT